MKKRIIGSFIFTIVTILLTAQNFCAEFDGVEDYIEIDDATNLQVTGSLTLEAWVYLYDDGTSDRAVMNYGAGSWDYGIWIYSGVPYFYSGDLSPASVSYATPVSLNGWTHLAVVYDNPNSKMYLYMDGSLINPGGSDVTGSFSYTFNRFHIGYPSASYITIPGKIDEVRVWDTVRDQNQIVANMYGELIGTESGLVGYWKLNEGFGQTVADITGNGGNGTFGAGTSIENSDPNWVVSDFPDEPLPVSLSTFTAIQTQSNFAQLNWTTQSETNNSYWNIYRAEKDDFSFAKTVNPAPVEGQGNSTSETNYTFTDESVSSTTATYWYWLESISFAGESNICASLSIEMSEPDNPTPPVNIVAGLHQNYPNPFNPDTKIQFAVEETSNAALSIFNQKGQKVITLFDGIAHPEQYYNIDWNGNDSNGKPVSSGIYYFKLKAGTTEYLKKAILMK